VSNKFVECDTCRAKPGSPVLCNSCLSNRALIEKLRDEAGKPQPKRVDYPVVQYFNYYLHDDDIGELISYMKGKKIKLSQDAWDAIDNHTSPFYEVTLECSVTDKGIIKILGVNNE